MVDRRIRPGVWAAVLAVLAAVLVVVFVMGPDAPKPPGSDAPDAQVEARVDAERSAPPVPLERQRTERSAAARAIPELSEPVPYIDGLVYGDIDLREARALMPDNLYWKWGSPTKDEKILAEREEERKRRNEEYGRVLSGDASEDEVNAYYDYRQKLSEDYLEFSEFMQRRYRNHENDQLVGLLELSMKLHAEKLAQLSAEREAALARARERAKIREDWRKQQEEFGAANTGPGGNQ